MTQEQIADLAKMDTKALIELVLKQKADLAKAESDGSGCKVSEKGAISVYGLGKWPVTLYRSQWERLFAKREVIETFIKANSAKLAVK